MRRAVAFFAILACGVSTGKSAEPIAVGTEVIVKSPHVRPRIGRRMVDVRPDGWALRATAMHDGWLWVGLGWLRAADVVPADQAIGWFTAEISHRPSAFAYLGRARALAFKSEYHRAFDDCQAAVRLAPKSARVYCIRGRTLEHLNSPAEALADYEHAMRLEPSDPTAFACRAHLRWDQHDFDGSMADISVAVRLSPNDPELYYFRASLAALQRDDKRGLKDFDQVIRLDPVNTEAWKGRARIRQRRHQYEPALADVNAVLAIAPDDTDAWLMGARIRRAMHETERAMGDVNRALAIDPSSTEAYCLRGALFSNQGDRTRAWADYDEALRLDPASERVHLRRGRQWATQGQFERALAEFRRAVQLAPASARALGRRGWAHVKLGQYDEALGDLDEAIRLDPHDPEHFISRAVANFFEDRLDLALSDVTEAIRLQPMGAGLYSDRAAFWLATEEYAKAIADCDEAIRLEPGFATAFANRGRCRWHLGDLAGALADYDQAIALDPNEALPWFRRGEMRLRQGHCREALADFDRSIDLDPTATRVYRRRTWALLRLGRFAAAACDWYRHWFVRLAAAEICERAGVFWNKIGCIPHSIAAYSMAMALDPTNNGNHIGRGWIFAGIGASGLAIADWEKARCLGSVPSEVTRLHAIFLNHTNRLPEAIDVLSSGLAIDPYDKHMLLLRGRLLLRQGHYDEALVDANSCIELDSNNAQAYLLRAEANLMMGKSETTRDDISRATRLDPTVATLWSAPDGREPAQPTADGGPTTYSVMSDQKAETTEAPKPPEIVEAEQRRAEIGRLITLARRLASSPDKRYRDGPRAVQLATEACELSGWADAGCLETLAAACAEAGDFTAAVRWQTKALERPGEGTPDNTSRRRLRLYQARRPFHEELW